MTQESPLWTLGSPRAIDKQMTLCESLCAIWRKGQKYAYISELGTLAYETSILSGTRVNLNCQDHKTLDVTSMYSKRERFNPDNLGLYHRIAYQKRKHLTVYYLSTFVFREEFLNLRRHILFANSLILLV